VSVVINTRCLRSAHARTPSSVARCIPMSRTWVTWPASKPGQSRS
jgi:hypothetical protein